jgi:hypothetical protein
MVSLNDLMSGNTSMNGDLSQEDKEIDSLLNLLKEYAEKLHDRSAAWLQRHHRLQWLFWSTLFFWSVLFSLFFLWWDKGAPLSAQYLPSVFVGVVGGAAIILWQLVVRRQHLLEANDIAMLVNVVEKLVRRSSQIQDHGSMNFTNQIALDLRLAEAEAALRLAKLVPRND